jgi:hypothetical protein
MADTEPIAWKYYIAPYCDHAAAMGICFRKEELPHSIPADKVEWTPLFKRREIEAVLEEMDKQGYG